MSPAPDASRPAAPAYLVKGDDPSLLNEAVHQLVAGLVGAEDPRLVVEEHQGGPAREAGRQGGPARPEPEGDVEAVGAILDACSTPAFLASRRVVVVREVGRFRVEEAARLASYLSDPTPTTSLVLVAGGGTVSPKLVAAVRKVGHVLDAASPTGRGRSAWMAEQLKGAPVRLDPRAIALVDQHLGADLGRLAGLLDSLGAAYGRGARLSVVEVEPFLGQAGGVMPWELTDAIDQGNTALALSLLRRLLEAAGRHPLTLMAVLYRHYGAMLSLDGAQIASDAQAAEVAGLKSAWSAAKARAQGRKLGSPGVARAIALLAAADLDLRGATGLPGEIVLEVLVARLSRLGPRRARSAGRR